MNTTLSPRFFLLTVLLLLLSLAPSLEAQNPGDYGQPITYAIQTTYANPVTNTSTQNPFCTKGTNCYFTETDVFTSSTTSSEIDVWTSTTIGSAIIATGWVAHAGAYVDQWIPSPGYWNQVTNSIVSDANPTARAPQTGVLSYLSATEGNYYGLAAFHCGNNATTNDYECFDTWFPTYNGVVTNTNPYVYDGPPQVNPPSQTPSGDPGSSGTITLTGTNFVNPFQGSGAAGVDAVPCNSNDLSLKVNSWSVNQTTGVETVVLGYTVPTGAAPGATCFTFDDHFADSPSEPFDVTSPNPAATPAFSPVAGTYTGTQNVSLKDTTSGATIYYTTNGTVPTTSSTKYTAPIVVSKTTTIKAIAAASGFDNSAVATGVFTIKVATPTFSPAPGTYTGTQTVTLKDATTGATIYYTTDGTTPTTGSTKYTAAITVSKTTTIKAIAAATGLTNSAVASGLFTIKVVTPTFSPAPGTYTGKQTITLKDVTTGATIYYTTNGTTPTTSSTKYTGAITVSATTTIKAIAAATGLANSAVASGTYTIN